MLLTEQANIPLDGVVTAGGNTSSFGDGFDAAFEEQRHNWSMYGMQVDFRDVDEANTRLVKELTGETLAPLDPFAYEAIAFDLDGREPKDAALARRHLEEYRKRNERLVAIKASNPDVKTYADMFGEIQERAKALEEHSSLVSQRGGVASGLGGFVGGMAGVFRMAACRRVSSTW